MLPPKYIVILSAICCITKPLQSLESVEPVFSVSWLAEHAVQDVLLYSLMTGYVALLIINKVATLIQSLVSRHIDTCFVAVLILVLVATLNEGFVAPGYMVSWLAEHAVQDVLLYCD
jgi:hypothetical protein